MTPEWEFIGESIEVRFERPPLFIKRPPVPSSFIWRGREWHVAHVLREWKEYHRVLPWAKQYRGEVGERRRRLGSYGVGRYLFEITTQDGNRWVIYYDRRPRGSAPRGAWILLKRWAGAGNQNGNAAWPPPLD